MMNVLLRRQLYLTSAVPSLCTSEERPKLRTRLLLISLLHCALPVQGSIDLGIRRTRSDSSGVFISKEHAAIDHSSSKDNNPSEWPKA